MGAEIVMKALRAPARIIAENAGEIEWHAGLTLDTRSMLVSSFHAKICGLARSHYQCKYAVATSLNVLLNMVDQCSKIPLSRKLTQA